MIGNLYIAVRMGGWKAPTNINIVSTPRFLLLLDFLLVSKKKPTALLKYEETRHGQVDPKLMECLF